MRVGVPPGPLVKVRYMKEMTKEKWIMFVVIVSVLAIIAGFAKLCPFWVTLSVILSMIIGFNAGWVFRKWYSENVHNNK